MDKDADPRLLRKRYQVKLPGGMCFEFDFGKVVDGVRVSAGSIKEVVKFPIDANAAFPSSTDTTFLGSDVPGRKKVYTVIPKIVKGDWVYPPTDVNCLTETDTEPTIVSSNKSQFELEPPLSTAWFDSKKIHEKERIAMSEFFDVNINLRFPSTSLTTGSGISIPTLKKIIETRTTPKQYLSMNDVFLKLRPSDVDKLSSSIDERYMRLRNTIIASYYAIQRTPKVYGEASSDGPIKLTFTAVRRSITFDSGALLRLFKFLESERLINYAHKRNNIPVNPEGIELGVKLVSPFKETGTEDGEDGKIAKGIVKNQENSENENMGDENIISTHPLNDAEERARERKDGANVPLFYQTDTSAARAIRKFFIGDIKGKVTEKGAYDKLLSITKKELNSDLTQKKEDGNTIESNEIDKNRCISCGCDCSFYHWKSLTTPSLSLCDDCYRAGEAEKVLEYTKLSVVPELEEEMSMKNVRFILVSGKEGEDWTTGETASLLKIIEKASDEGRTWVDVAREFNNTQKVKLEKNDKKQEDGESMFKNESGEDERGRIFRNRTPEECLLRFLQIPEYDSLIDITLGRKPNSLSVSGDTAITPASYVVPPGLHAFTQWNGESDGTGNANSTGVISILSQLAERTTVEALNTSVNAAREFFKSRNTTRYYPRGNEKKGVENPFGSVENAMSGSENTMAAIAGVLGARIAQAELGAEKENERAMELLVEALSHKIHILEERLKLGI